MGSYPASRPGLLEGQELFQKAGAMETPCPWDSLLPDQSHQQSMMRGAKGCTVFSFPTQNLSDLEPEKQLPSPCLIPAPERMRYKPKGHLSPITTIGASGQACKGTVSKRGATFLFCRGGKVAASRQPQPGPGCRNSSLGSWGCGAKGQNPRAVPSGNWIGGKDRLA